ncbi:MAG TPA: DegT/DnrJ/EryC1/StrS family aminotransferase [Thermoanaerobaculia bacterium]|nr:DegT/DnrJ/EryC1/StrS family aminotransferase [Thermoanaerobaculia bacterium]
MDETKRRVLINPSLSIRDTLRVIDAGGLAIALIVDDRECLRGSVTDGDIRRAILRGAHLDERVETIMNCDPVTVTPTTDMQDIRSIFIESSLKHIPVVDHDRRVLDILLVSDLLSVPLSNPDITDREIAAVLEVLHTPNLSLGPKVTEFEARIAAFANRKFAVAVNSGTSGLHLVVRALGLGEGDEVITTPFSFIASSNCLLYERAIPRFVDIDADTYNIDPAKIEAAITPRTKAILAVDVFGQPAKYDVIAAIADKHGLKLISDCCESIGAEYLGRKSSIYGEAGVFAFYPNKQITTGEGGAVITDDPDVARLCRSMRNQGRGEGGGWLAHERLGYNYRLSDISCALGIVQIQRLDDILTRRQRVADVYMELLHGVEEIHAPFVHPNVTRMSWFVYVVRLGDKFTREDRDEIIQDLRRHGIGANNYFPPIHLQPFYRQQFGYDEGAFPITESVANRTIALPFHNNLTSEDCSIVVSRLKEAMTRVGSPSVHKGRY